MPRACVCHLHARLEGARAAPVSSLRANAFAHVLRVSAYGVSWVRFAPGVGPSAAGRQTHALLPRAASRCRLQPMPLSFRWCARAQVSGLGKRCVVSLAAAKHHMLAATGSGEVYSWGSNAAGKLGYAAVDTQPTPRK